MVLSNDNSTSCNTLIDLNDIDFKRLDGESRFRSVPLEQQLVKTQLFLAPEDEFLEYDYDSDGECEYTTAHDAAHVEQSLYLPQVSEEIAIDRHLSFLPSLVERSEMLLANPPRNLHPDSDTRILNVCQRELAHAVPSQCDIIASDMATTCHILAIRSELSEEPLTSLTHVDGVGYEDCIRGMIQEHKMHHFGYASCDLEEEKKQELSAENDRIEMELHLLGGFEDEEGVSRQLSEYLIRLLARIAEEETASIKMTLKTCAISMMNDDGFRAPVGRGLGINLRTGEAFLVAVQKGVEGPVSDLRAARLWAEAEQPTLPVLSVIHTAKSDTIQIQPFEFASVPNLDTILNLPDKVLLQCTSTSPDVEHNDFCNNLRRTLTYMRYNDCKSLFGPDCAEPITYVRTESNEWERTVC
eukprot:scaffold320826_cov53-Attheya_sp.AAC.4